MRSLNLALLLLLAALEAHAADVGRPMGQNCGLGAPPPMAGEELNHNLVMKVYPRARDISVKYSECQIMWMPRGNDYVVVAVAEIVNGDPVGLWAPDRLGDQRFACRYAKGVVISGPAQKCAAPEYLIVKSVAPGCVEKIKTAVAARGLGAAMPPGCEYE